MIFIYPDLRQVKERTHDTGLESSTKGTLIVVLPMNLFTVQKHGVVVQYWPPGVYQVGSHKDQIGIQLIHTTSQDAIKEKQKKNTPTSMQKKMRSSCSRNSPHQHASKQAPDAHTYMSSCTGWNMRAAR